MNNHYTIKDTDRIVSPALIVFRDLVEENIARMIRIAGDAARLRPHCKTHKMPDVTRIELRHGITKHKAATMAEAEMVAGAGAAEVFLAYNPVGPNIARAVRFTEKFPDVKFAVTADHPGPLAALGEAMAAAGRSVEVLLDVDTGLHRTGVSIGPDAKALYGRIVESEALQPGGLHLYDGHIKEPVVEKRRAQVNAVLAPALEFRDSLVAEGWPVPRIVAGGTVSFPIYAEKDDPALELSPGTCVFNDSGYGEMYRDLPFTPAAVLLTRVISRPTPDRVTLDLGSKAVAADPPAGNRMVFPDLPDAREVMQNEEHLVLTTSRAGEFQPGDELIAIPRHVCPTSALHKQVHVVSGGSVVDQWPVVARDRVLTV